MNDYDLCLSVEQLINSKREDDYWDFKQSHHTNKADLVHDIICMANNRADRDSYIIFGIEDSTFEICGVEGDLNRRNQQNLIDILKGLKFSSGIRPRIELRKMNYYDHEIDILVIKNSNDTPYFLNEDYKEKGRCIRANYIYTRVCDTNTDIDKSADINMIEYLWKKRFLLTRTPFEQLLGKLKNKQQWRRHEDIFYHIFNPEFTIEMTDEERDRVPEFYSYAMMNESTMYRMMHLKYYSTTMLSLQSVVLDGGRYSTPVPTWEFLHFHDKIHPDHAFKYFIEDDPDYKLNEFLFDDSDEEEAISRRSLFSVVLLFRDIKEKDGFISYVYNNQKTFEQKLKEVENDFKWLETESKKRDAQVALRLRVGTILNQMLTEYRV